MARHWIRGLLCVVIGLCPSTSPAQDVPYVEAAAPPLLPQGPFEVGFRSSWDFDEGRTYRTSWDEGGTYGATKSARPVLVLEWYPVAAGAGSATGEASRSDAPVLETRGRMAHGGYFAITSEDPRLASYGESLRRHALGIFAEQVFGSPEGGAAAAHHAELERALAAPTHCLRDAEPAPGPFPLVLYHSGAGSSFEDNSGLCEFLASHGYVVVGSAYTKADGSELGIDAGRGSAQDAQFLVRRARALACVDWSRIALIGHSAGAQAFLKYAAEPGCVADALVLLDTTQDYYALSLPLHTTLVEEVTRNQAELTSPMLVAASPDAIFALCDKLVGAERYYVTVPELAHDEFISQGLQRLERIDRDAGANGGGVDEAARIPAVRVQYRELCDTVLVFLDAELRGDRTKLDARLALDRGRPWTHQALRCTHVPRGVAGPDPWEPESSAPPTPRQFVRLLTERGAIDAGLVLERFRDVRPPGPLYTSTMLAGSMLYTLVEGGRNDEARRYLATLKGIPLDALSLFQFLADISAMQGKRDQALRFLRLACELDPENADLAASLRAVEEPQGR